MNRKTILLNSVKFSLLSYLDSATLYQLARITNALNIDVINQDRYADVPYINAITNYINVSDSNVVKVLQIIEDYE